MKQRGKRMLFLLLAVGGVLFGAFGTGKVQAASSYTNARQFYESTEKSDYTEIYKGSIYVSTKAKKASSSSNVKYITLGHDVTLSAGGCELTFSVKRNSAGSPSGSMVDVDETISGNYVYNLYRIPLDSIRTLAYAKDSAAASKIFSNNIIYVDMDSIMTTKKGDKVYGSIEENGKGDVRTSGTVYRLIHESTDLQAMQTLFPGHTFMGFFNIRNKIKNYPIQLIYDVDGGTVTADGYSAVNDILYRNGSRYLATYRLYDVINLYDFSTLGLTKTGYHAEQDREWKYNYRGTVFSQSKNYTSQDIEPDIGTSEQTIGVKLTANWVANQYTVQYHANGGNGSVPEQEFTYDTEETLRNNTFKRTGYQLKEGAEWNTKADGSGQSYSSGQTVQNLVSEQNGVLTLYAMWEPCEYQITLFKDGGTDGEDDFYELYDRYFFIQQAKEQKIESLLLPFKTGYLFDGYYRGYKGLGERIIHPDGRILVNSNYFFRNEVLFANWIAKEYTVTFEKQGGMEGIGTDTAKVRYEETYPFATAPVRQGYSFGGYFEEKNGKGEQVYTENMAPLGKHTKDGDITLYAHWTDDVLPKTSLSVSTSYWTNRAGGVEVVANAYDFGSGLDYAELYCDGILIDSKSSLNGAKETSFELTHKEEGAFRYSILAYDLAGNCSEAYAYVQYDITKPRSEGSTPSGYLYTLKNTERTEENLRDFGISIFATDQVYD